MNIVGFVFARGGSKGVYRKNLRNLDGKSLVRRAVESGLGSRYIDNMYVSTDDPDIADEAQASGATVPFLRPAELATDEVAEHAAWQHAVRTCNELSTLPSVDVLVSIPPTVPLRTSADIDLCVETFLSGSADVVMSVTEADSNPYFNTVTMDHNGLVRRVVELPNGVVRRQDAPAVYQIVPAAYVCRGEFVLSSNHYLEGRVQAVAIPRQRAVDIDTELDLEWAEFLCRRQADGSATTHPAA